MLLGSHLPDRVAQRTTGGKPEVASQVERQQDIPSLCWPLSWWVVGQFGNLLINVLMGTGSVILLAVFP
jgi:hypothetical protein